MWQSVLVNVIVAFACVYAAWSLGPQAIRQRLRALASGVPLLPTALRQRLQAGAAQSGGCHCDGCGSPKPLAPQVQRLVFHKPKK